MKKLLIITLLLSIAGLNAMTYTWLSGKKGDIFSEDDLPKNRGFLGELLFVTPQSTNGFGALAPLGMDKNGIYQYKLVKIIEDMIYDETSPTIKVDNGKDQYDESAYSIIVLVDEEGNWRPTGIEITN